MNKEQTLICDDCGCVIDRKKGFSYSMEEETYLCLDCTDKFLIDEEENDDLCCQSNDCCERQINIDDVIGFIDQYQAKHQGKFSNGKHFREFLFEAMRNAF